MVYSTVPNLNADGTNASAIDMNCTTAADQTGHACYTDVIDEVIKYEGDFDGVGISATYGYGRWKH